MLRNLFADDFYIDKDVLTIWYYNIKTMDDYVEWECSLSTFFKYCNKNNFNTITIESFRPELGQHLQKIIKPDNFTWWYSLELSEKLLLLTGFLRNQLANKQPIIYIELRLHKKAG